MCTWCRGQRAWGIEVSRRRPRAMPCQGSRKRLNRPFAMLTQDARDAKKISLRCLFFTDSPRKMRIGKDLRPSPVNRDASTDTYL